MDPFRGPDRDTAKGAQARWSRDGKQIFYIALDEKMMAVPIHFDATGQRAEPGQPKPLFTTQVGGAIHSSNSPWQFDVAADGRFLMRNLTNEFNTSPITVIMNWKPRP